MVSTRGKRFTAVSANIQFFPVCRPCGWNDAPDAPCNSYYYVNLGRKKMVKKQVIVKRLNSIENFGSLNILCSDKTGTLTEGVMKLQSAVDYAGNNSDKVLLYSYLNAYFESGLLILSTRPSVKLHSTPQVIQN